MMSYGIDFPAVATASRIWSTESWRARSHARFQSS